jgi:hypothetical protein
MTRTVKFSIFGLAAFATLTASVALTQDKKAAPAAPAPADAAQQEMEKEMAAVMAAATPGPMHKFLCEGAGTWKGKNTMWMGEGAPPVQSDSKAVVTPFLDNRFTRVEVSGDMPGMGMFSGFGVYGYDNVAKQFQCTWMDSMGTGMATGTGELSADGKTMTWTLTYNCPIQKKPVSFKEVDRITGKDTRTMEMWGNDPKTGKEFKMMEVLQTRAAGAK